MNNNIKPTRFFFGVFLITLLWALEFDNRPNPRQPLSTSPGRLNSSTIEHAGTQRDQVNGRNVGELSANEMIPAQARKPGRINYVQLHRDRLLSDSANRQRPAQEPVVASPGKEPVEPFRDNDPLHAADRLYSCFGNSCLNVIADH